MAPFRNFVFDELAIPVIEQCPSQFGWDGYITRPCDGKDRTAHFRYVPHRIKLVFQQESREESNTFSDDIHEAVKRRYQDKPGNFAGCRHLNSDARPKTAPDNDY